MSNNSSVISDEMLQEQRGYCAAVKEIYGQKLRRQPLAYTQTFGCQQNEADTELIRGMLADMGFGFCESIAEADIVIINTCAIREHAEMRVYGNVGELSHAKKNNPELVTVLCGCMAQQEHVTDKIKNSYPYVDIVFGTHALPRFPQILYNCLKRKKRVFDIDGDEKGTIIEGVEPVRKPGYSAWLSIMYGCNNFCSYCVVPYVRGRERSRTPRAVIEEFKSLVAQGYKDITLLGQNVNSYGRGLDNACDFPSLLEQINDIDGDFRVRFMTSHPKDATPGLFDVMAKCDKVCNSIHLPVQAGSDRVLKDMNRSYTAEKYLSLIDYARKVMPDITITSDIIVGFPGETNEDFQKTIDLLEKVRFDSLFTFIFSPRKGTKAYDMPDVLTKDEKQRNFDRLLEVQNRISKEKNEEYVGKRLRVLVGEEENERNYNNEYTKLARTEGFKLVYLRGAEGLEGQYADVIIEKSSTWALFGSVEIGEK
ncbi:MAG: tRNA (N6-isopentenyl adenosine(37)-C2)-methylthiotransferase MiaB [Clostridiaceae bacterium]|nr:tRNA (N6-isopentenyl adenosine(37)-C2)-methylthiotransferase MiaB [Clostridiaceae bacterium]